MATDAGRPEEHMDPVLELVVNLTREGALVSAFQSVHEKFLRYHAELLRLAASVGSDERARDELLRTLDAYAELFHEHHQAEDNYLFPALRRAEPALNSVVDELGQQHEQLAAQLNVVLERARHLESAEVQGEGIPLLIEDLRTLQAVVEEHLRFEEATTVPVVGSWTSWPR